MGSVGSIEKVMVGTILAIILLILAVAFNGNRDEPLPARAGSDGGEYADLNAPRIEDRIPDPHAAEPSAARGPAAGAEESDRGGSRQETPAVREPDDYREVAATRIADVEIVGQEREPAVPRDGRPRTYTIKSGDTFSAIAERVLGSVRYLDDLVKANEDVDPRRLFVGQVINLPAVGRLGAADEGILGAAETPSGGDEPTTARAPAARTHRVVKGDTLYGIARKYYGSVGRWKDILEANRNVIASPAALRPGMVLSIPQ